MGRKNGADELGARIENTEEEGRSAFEFVFVDSWFCDFVIVVCGAEEVCYDTEEEGRARAVSRDL